MLFENHLMILEMQTDNKIENLNVQIENLNIKNENENLSFVNYCLECEIIKLNKTFDIIKLRYAFKCLIDCL